MNPLAYSGWKNSVALKAQDITPAPARRSFADRKAQREILRQAHAELLSSLAHALPNLFVGAEINAEVADALFGDHSPEFLSILKESDPEFFHRGLLHLAHRLTEARCYDGAAQLYQFLLGQNSFADVAEQAELEWNALKGQGALGLQFEHTLNEFLHETMEPSTLIAMGLASATFKFAQFAALSKLWQCPVGLLTRGLGARALAFSTGLIAESSVFTLAGKGLRTAFGKPENWDADALSKELLRNGLTFALFKLTDFTANEAAQVWAKGPGAFQAFSRDVFPQGGMFGGIFLSQNLSQAWGWAPPQNSHENLFHSLVQLFQFNIAGNLARGTLGGALNAAEADFEARLRKSWSFGYKAEGNFLSFPAMQAFSPFLAEAIASSHGSVSADFHELWLKPLYSRRFPTRGEAEALSQKFRPYFPRPSERTYSKFIVQAAFSTPSEKANFHERLLEAYASAPNPGLLPQRYLSEVIEKTFHYDAANSSTASFDHAVLQSLITRALAEEEPARRNKTLHAVFKAMEGGLTRLKMTHIFHQAGYLQAMKAEKSPAAFEDLQNQFASLISQEWKEYREHHKIVMGNFVAENSKGDLAKAEELIRIFGRARDSGRFHPREIEDALEYASYSPLGKLILDRIFHVLSNPKEIPEKLRELRINLQEKDTLKALRKLWGQKLSPEQIAQKINGSLHTSYIQDIRLARKVVSVFGDIDLWLSKSSLERATARERFERALSEFVLPGSPLFQEDAGSGSKLVLTPSHLIRLLETNPNEAIQTLKEDWNEGRGKFMIEILRGEEFDKLVTEMWGSADGYVGFFIRSRKPEGKGKLVIRELPGLDLSSEEGRDEAAHEIFQRLLALVHEWEHWRHFSGNFSGIEAPGTKIELTNITRQDRLSSEIMAFLEQQRWRIQNVENHVWELASIMGHNLSFYYRDFNDWSYFRRENAKSVASFHR